MIVFSVSSFLYQLKRTTRDYSTNVDVWTNWCRDRLRSGRKYVHHLGGVPLWEEPIIRFAYQPICGPDDVQVCVKVVSILRKLCAQRVDRAVCHVELRARAFFVPPEYLVERLRPVIR